MSTIIGAETMEKAEGITIQAVLSAALAAISCYINTLIIPVIILISVMIIDYLTGMAVAWNSGGLSSKKGIKGIAKKVLYFVLVIVGMVVDWSVMYWLSSFGAGEVYKFSFGALVAFWLIMNELISILENLEALKVPVPKFLTKVVKRLKVTAEKTAETAEKESEEKKDEKGN